MAHSEQLGYLCCAFDEEDSLERCCQDREPDRDTQTVPSGRGPSPTASTYLAPQKGSEPDEGPTFNFLDLLIGMSSIALFYVDVVTDILVAREYYNKELPLEFMLTAFFVIVPALVICILNFILYHRSKRMTCHPILRIVRFIMTILMMGPVIRQLEYMYNGIKSSNSKLAKSERRHHYENMCLENEKGCFLRVIECFLEAAPQLVIQIYILMQNCGQETLFTEIIRGTAIVSSWVSISCSIVAILVADQKVIKIFNKDKKIMTIPGMVFSFLWRTAEIGPRVLALSLFAAQFTWLAFIVVGIHLLFMSLYCLWQKNKSYQNRCEDTFVSILYGYVLVICFMNPFGGRTRYRMLVYSILIYIENCTIMGFWFYFTDDKSAWFYMHAFFIIVLGVIVQLFSQLFYYTCFHPLGRGEIPCCTPQGENTCSFQSLCLDRKESTNQNYTSGAQTRDEV